MSTCLSAHSTFLLVLSLWRALLVDTWGFGQEVSSSCKQRGLSQREKYEMMVPARAHWSCQRGPHLALLRPEQNLALTNPKQTIAGPLPHPRPLPQFLVTWTSPASCLCRKWPQSTKEELCGDESQEGPGLQEGKTETGLKSRGNRESPWQRAPGE